MSYLISLVKFYRVRDWIHLLGITLLGFVYVSCNPVNYLGLSVCILLSSLYLAFGYSSNTVFEQFLLGKGHYHNLALSVLPAVLLLPMAGFYSVKMLLVFFVGVILSIAYSAPPFNLKSRPIMELFVNSSLFTVLFLVGSIVVQGTITYNALVFSVFVFTLTIPFQLIQELGDMDVDRSNNLMTTAIYAKLLTVKAIMISSTVISMLLSLIIPLPSQGSIWFNALTLLLCAFILIRTITLRNNDIIQFKQDRLIMRYAAIVYGTALLAVLITNPPNNC